MTFFLDTETTGLWRGEGAELVEVALMDETGKVWVDTLVKPEKPIPSGATAVHGITDDMVKDAPMPEAIIASIYIITEGHTVVIYNAPFDCQWFPDLDKYATIADAMIEYAPLYGEWDDYHQSYRWPKLTNASERVGFRLPEGMNPHRALADCLAARAVWNYTKNAGNPS